MHILRTPRPFHRGSTSTPLAGTIEGAVELGVASELAERKRCALTVSGVELLVISHPRRFTVVVNRCPHLGRTLEDAHLSRRSLTCAWHGYRYSLVDGAFVSAPRCRPGNQESLTIVPTRVLDGRLYAWIDTTRAGAECT